MYQYKPRKAANTYLINKNQKRAARKAVAYALKTKKITRQSCEYADCSVEKTQAHHPNYNLPLAIIWLCRTHHMELHKNFSTVIEIANTV